MDSAASTFSPVPVSVPAYVAELGQSIPDPEVVARVLARRSVGWGLLILLVLQVWRPFFFLTDDNLVGSLPVLSAMGRNLVHGQSPFWISTLFGGFDLLRDPSTLCLWNPFVLALALLTQTPARLAVIDLFVGAHLLLAVFCCAHLLALWRTRFGLGLSDRRLVFVSVSYAFSAYSIIVCASWSTFSPNIAAAPLALLGMFHQNRRVGLSLVLASTLVGILDGHLSPFLWASTSLSVFAVLWPLLCARSLDATSTCSRQAWEVPLRWFVGNAAGVALCAPLLWLASSGFASTARNASFAAHEVLQMQVPPLTFGLSWLAGSLSVLASEGEPLHLVELSIGSSGAIVACAGAYFVLLSLLAASSSSGRGLKWQRCDSLFALLCAAAVLLVARPVWLQSLIENVPLLRSLRFPFREIWLFHLWTHIWMAWRGSTLTTRVARLSGVAGTCVLLASLLAWEPPTFTRISATREWIVSGRADQFWAWIKPQLPPRARVLPASTFEQWKQADRLPLPLICAYNFPALFDVTSPGGYVIKGMERGNLRRGHVGGSASMRSPAQARDALSRDPNLILVRIKSLEPITIEFRGRHFLRAVRPDEMPGS